MQHLSAPVTILSFKFQIKPNLTVHDIAFNEHKIE